MKLYIDMGNSCLKLLLDDGDISTATLLTQSYEDADWLSGVTTVPRQIIALHVTDEQLAKQLEQQCRRHWAMDITWLRSTASAAGLHNAYSVPEHLGVDRWAAMAGAFSLSRQDLVVADFGTATTIDAVTASGQHLGGWIVPGAAGMRSLQQQRLPHLYRPGAQPGKPVKLAVSTTDALEAGIWQTQLAALQRFVSVSIEAGLDQPLCVLTGGFAGGIADLWELPVRVEPRLVFFGMQQLLYEHMRQNPPKVR